MELGGGGWMEETQTERGMEQGNIFESVSCEDEEMRWRDVR